MGAGNPSLRSYDNELYVPTTYFIDFSTEDDEDDEFLYENIFEDITESLSSELELTILSDKRGNFESDSDLSSNYRGEGILLLEGENCFVISETGSDHYHLPIGVIPNFKFENILDEIQNENHNKQSWYYNRGLSFDAMIEKLASKKWDKMLKNFYKEEKTIVDKLKQFYPESLSVRSGPWTSSKIN